MKTNLNKPDPYLITSGAKLEQTLSLVDILGPLDLKNSSGIALPLVEVVWAVDAYLRVKKVDVVVRIIPRDVEQNAIKAYPAVIIRTAAR